MHAQVGTDGVACMPLIRAHGLLAGSGLARSGVGNWVQGVGD